MNARLMGAVAVAAYCTAVACGCRPQTKEAYAVHATGVKKPWLALAARSCRGEMLTVETDGTATVRLGTPRQNGYIGTFQLVLPPDGLAELREAVGHANLDAMRDQYPPRKFGPPGPAWVEITVVTPKGQKTVRATESSVPYPTQLKRLYDLTKPMPGTEKTGPVPEGILSRLIGEVSAHPVSAIGAEIRVAKRRFQAGEPIAPLVVVRSVGSQDVLVPPMNSRALAFGKLDLQLRHHPLRPEEASAGLDQVLINIGPSRPKYLETLTDAAREDMRDMVRIEPGGEWHIRPPRPLTAGSAGEYELVASYSVGLLYQHAVVEQELGRVVVVGSIWMSPVRIKVTE